MQIDTKVVSQLQDVVSDLEGVEKSHIRAQERLTMESEKLAELGFNSVDEAEKGLAALTKKIEAKGNRVEAAFEEFMSDYGESLE